MNRVLAQEAEEKGEQRLRVRVLFFGAAREIAGSAELELELQAPSRATSALEEVLSRYPELRLLGRSLLLAVNQEYAREDLDWREGDELALFPPVSGRAGATTPTAA